MATRVITDRECGSTERDADKRAMILLKHRTPERMAPAMMRIYCDDLCAYAGDLQSYPGCPLFGVVELIHDAAVWLKSKGAEGVIIHVRGKNVNRKTYKRLGFVPVHGCPGLLSASLCDVIAQSERRRSTPHG